MLLKSEKGFTGVDISISVVILFIFISFIVMISQNYISKIKELELKSEATYLAIDEIEKVKNKGFEEYKDNKESDGIIEGEELQQGFYRTIKVQDYTDIPGNETKDANIVKKVNVKIEYKYKKNIENVELSTILSKEK